MVPMDEPILNLIKTDYRWRMSMQITPRLERETAREYAFRMIKENIVCLELLPGSMVSESELSAEMGLSRTPVREALIELGKLHLIEIYPQKGSFISLIDSEIVEEARFLRLVLEKAMVEEICDFQEEQALLPMKENLRLQEFYLQQKSPSQLLNLDNEFHRLLFVIAKKEHIYQLLAGITIHFNRARRLALFCNRDMNIVSEHKAMLEAMENKDRQLATSILTEHLEHYKVDEKALKEKYPNYFK